jgi:hypothetical protein
MSNEKIKTIFDNARERDLVANFHFALNGFNKTSDT